VDIVEIKHISEIPDLGSPYYWDFPEVLYTWGLGIKNSRLLKVGRGVYLRGQTTKGVIASWQTEESSEEVLYALRTAGFKSLKFQALSNDLREVFPGGSRETVWHTLSSWRSNSALDSNRRWQFKKALEMYDFDPVTPRNLVEALDILERWRAVSEERHGNIQLAAYLRGLPNSYQQSSEINWVRGIGHYRACIQLHSQLPNSHLFFCRDLESGKRVGIVGGYIRGTRAVAVLVKHDYSSNWLADALWGFWLDYVHLKLGATFSSNGSTADGMKRRLGMSKDTFYRPKSIRL